MSCQYYEDRGGLFSTNPYCKLIQNSVSNEKYKFYCSTSRYSECDYYKEHNSSCYLTTACVMTKGLPDDCYELETLREFRDQWLKKQADGERLIKRYYDIAPRIVSEINKREDSKIIYEKLYDSLVEPCVKMIKEKCFEEATELYKKTTVELEHTYLSHD